MATTKKQTATATETEKVQAVVQEFGKEQLLASAKYRDKRDLVDALLDDKKKYTMEQVDKLINDYMKGKVK